MTDSEKIDNLMMRMEIVERYVKCDVLYIKIINGPVATVDSINEKPQTRPSDFGSDGSVQIDPNLTLDQLQQMPDDPAGQPIMPPAKFPQPGEDGYKGHPSP